MVESVRRRQQLHSNFSTSQGVDFCLIGEAKDTKVFFTAILARVEEMHVRTDKTVIFSSASWAIKWLR